jgi:hypothetical protein
LLIDVVFAVVINDDDDDDGILLLTDTNVPSFRFYFVAPHYNLRGIVYWVWMLCVEEHVLEHWGFGGRPQWSGSVHFRRKRSFSRAKEHRSAV